MQITLEIPDAIGQRLDRSWGNISQKLLEVFVIESYRSGAISTAEVGHLLQLPSRLETHAFLKRMGVYLNYDSAELEEDLHTIEKLIKA